MIIRCSGFTDTSVPSLADASVISGTCEIRAPQLAKRTIIREDHCFSFHVSKTIFDAMLKRYCPGFWTTNCETRNNSNKNLLKLSLAIVKVCSEGLLWFAKHFCVRFNAFSTRPG